MQNKKMRNHLVWSARFVNKRYFCDFCIFECFWDFWLF